MEQILITLALVVSQLLSHCSARTAVNLIPNGLVRLFPDNIDNEQCSTDQQTLSTSYDSFALPSSSYTTILAEAVYCNSTSGVLLRMSPTEQFSIDCQNQRVLLEDTLSAYRYSIPVAGLTGTATIKIAINSNGTSTSSTRDLGLCINGSSIYRPSIEMPQPLMLSKSIGLGSSIGISARADVSQYWLIDGSFDAVSDPCSINFDDLISSNSQQQAVDISIALLEEDDIVVGSDISITVSINSKTAGKLSLTYYGLPPASCPSATECGDYTTVFNFASTDATSTTVVLKGGYSKPGRYLIRAAASTGNGYIYYKDVTVLVRKQGDVNKTAPCCRHTPHVIALQDGRPVHDTQFNTTGDLEAERLFDYTILAPVVSQQQHQIPYTTVTCLDTHVAGAGGPKISLKQLQDTRGHNKKLVIIPLGFPWAESSDVNCQKHWSGSHMIPSSYYRPAANCSVGCTKAGTQHLITYTGMYDHYNQALIQSSYGALSLDPNPIILDTVQVARDATTNDGDVFSYYQAPALEALQKQGITDYWMYIILTPVAYHKIPPHGAWSGGSAGRNVVITDCFASLYYSVHETGHRLGFGHSNIYQRLSVDGSRLQQKAPINPLGPGAVKDGGYSDKLDTMGCCKASEFGLIYHSLAGWFQGSSEQKLLVLSTSDLVDSKNTYQLVMWPFDRSESRGKMMSATLRLSNNEILVMGYRSVPSWSDSGSASRLNIRGLQVEYLKRDDESGEWTTDKSLLDFNLLHADWPDAFFLPNPSNSRESASKHGEYALLKEARSWYISSTKTLITFKSIGSCDGASGSVLYNYTVNGFNGYRGDNPRVDEPREANYTGYAGLECAHIEIQTAVEAPKGKLAVTVGLLAPIVQQQQKSLCLDSSSTYMLQSKWDAKDEVVSAVWKTPLNQTTIVTSSSSSSVVVTATSAGVWSLSVAARDGRHTLLQVIITDKAAVLAKYRYYYQQDIKDESVVLVSSNADKCTDKKQGSRSGKLLLIGVIVVSLCLIIVLLAALAYYFYQDHVANITGAAAVWKVFTGGDESEEDSSVC